jgi:selenocysteine-specific elongation factor
MHAEQPLLGALPIADVRDRAGLSEALLQVALADLGERVVVEARTLRLADHSVTLDPETERAADAVRVTLDGAGYAPPAKEKLAEAAGLSTAELKTALTLLTDQGQLREVAPGLLYTTGRLDEGLRKLHAIAAKRGTFEPVDAKAVLGGISRKWLIPLLEYYDKLGATRRDGNERRITPRGDEMAKNGLAGT